MKTPTKKVEPSTSLITQKNVLAIQQQQRTLRSLAESTHITNEQECQSARTLLTRIIAARDKAAAFIKPILDNAKEGLKLAKEQEVQLVGPLEELRVLLKCTINSYLTDVMQKEREERERQDELKRQHEERLERSKRPERIKPLELAPIPEPPKMENTSIPMVPKYEIIDESLIPEHYWKRVLDRDALWSDIRAAHRDKKPLEVAGVRIWEEASLTIRK